MPRIFFSFLLMVSLFTPGFCRAAEASSPEGEATRKEVAAFIDSYFATWSKGDMKGYAAHFHEKGTIHFVSGNGKDVTVQIKGDFVKGQEEGHLRSPRQMVEIPLTTTIQLTPDHLSAQALVHWELDRGAGPKERGYDLFNLRRIEGVWMIMDLTFYGE